MNFSTWEEIVADADREGEVEPISKPPGTPGVLEIIGKGLTAEDLIDAHRRDADQRQRQIESEPLPATIYDVVAEAAAEVPDQLAWNFFETEEAWTYRQIVDTVNCLASALSRLGVAKGTHVGVMLPNRPAFPLTWLALGRLGAVMIPINIGYTGRELDYVVNDGDVDYLVIDAACLPTLDAMAERPARLAEERIVVHGGPIAPGRHGFDALIGFGDPDFVPFETAGPDDLMNIQYTSGTTGFPKGCMLTHSYWVGTGKVAARRDGIVLKNIFANQPFYYMDPQWMTLMAAFQRGTLHAVLKPSGSRFMERARRFSIHFCIFPEVVYKQPAHARDADNAIRRANIYGIRPSIHASIEERFNFAAREAFGMTEVGSTLFVPIEDRAMVGQGSCGRPVAFRRCRIVDDEGRDVPVGEVGELIVAGFNIIRGYYKKPEATAQAFFGEWFRTGDLFRRDARGYHYIVGRKKDMIRRSGENIAAREVESVLLEMPEVRDVAVIGVKDPDRGEEVKALVVLAPGHSPQTVPPARLLDHARSRLARFKVPRYVAYRDSFPRTPSMKIRKGELRSETADLRQGAYDAVDNVWR
ncbi:AMP-binding protein [Kaustia mangrovi]|uniref:AMP-binding protein n=1 Tax=Kaustia mangrovi TaxID=2593653 RepID=A0A7S8C391_9HYPH|nr:AMP-binding protein [Kaustia mangrovi]QPC42527.1 AMP-binding protein [Kaustia mangrovi]